jgi:hypothetical protein
VILKDGTKIEIKDKIGFAEKVHNKWWEGEKKNVKT